MLFFFLVERHNTEYTSAQGKPHGAEIWTYSHLLQPGVKIMMKTQIDILEVLHSWLHVCQLNHGFDVWLKSCIISHSNAFPMHIITHQSTSIHSREALPAPIPLTDELLHLPKNGNHDTEKFLPCLFASKIVTWEWYLFNEFFNNELLPNFMVGPFLFFNFNGMVIINYLD